MLRHRHLDRVIASAAHQLGADAGRDFVDCPVGCPSGQEVVAQLARILPKAQQPQRQQRILPRQPTARTGWRATPL